MILDTAVLVNAERDRADVDRIIDDEDDAAIAAITVAELLVGVEMADQRHRRDREVFVSSVVKSFVIEGYDLDVARCHARLLASGKRSGQPRGAHDLIVAATALARDRVLVSPDVRAFGALPGVKTRRSL